jgi:hypothetical protein
VARRKLALDPSAEARAAATALLDSAEYQASLRRRILAGTLPPALEILLWHYRYGRPVERVNLNVAEVAELSTSELEARTRELLAQLQAPPPSTELPSTEPSANIFDFRPRRETIQ